MLPLFESQQKGIERWLETPGMLNLSCPGTGKTRTTLEGILQRNSGGRTLVLAPLSILQPAWGDDIEKWTPALRYSIAYAKNRAQAFRTKTDIVITNHDAVKWIADNIDILAEFDTLVVDEFTAFKNPDSQRTKALIQLRKCFEYVYMLSGTPNPQSVTDLWVPVLMCDGGMRLGNLFYKFRAQVCYPRQVGKSRAATQWVDRSDALEKVMMQIDDLVYRVPLEGLPENREYTIYTSLPDKIMKQYKQLAKESLIWLESGDAISAVHAGARLKKMLQLLTGAVYDSQGESHLVHTERYEVVMQLVAERSQSLVAFNWRHERENLVKLAEKMGISYGVIDGEVPVKRREQIVSDFQAGLLKVIFAHPQSAGHGLTLTKGVATIWCSPTYNSEHYMQFNRRIFRTGQTKRTETIRIAARGTCEGAVYEKLDGKIQRVEDFLLSALRVSQAA